MCEPCKAPDLSGAKSFLRSAISRRLAVLTEVRASFDVAQEKLGHALDRLSEAECLLRDLDRLERAEVIAAECDTPLDVPAAGG